MFVDDDVYKLNEQLISLILQEGSLDKKDNDVLIGCLKAAYDLENWHVPYDLISDKVYGIESRNITSSIGEKFDYVLHDSRDLLDEKWLKKIKDDVVRNVNLALVQKNYIDRSVDDVVEKSRDIKKRIDEMGETIKKNIKGVRNIKSDIYTDFVTILGIFTAIAFTAFGGLKLISGVLGNFRGSVSRGELGMLLIVTSIILLSTYLILLSLLTGVSKLLSFTRDEDKEYHFTTKVTFSIIFLIVVLLILGVVLFAS